MKKILMIFIACLVLSSCNAATASDIVSLDEVSRLVFDEGYSQSDVLEMIRGVNYEDLADRWGEHGFLSGFWGDVWSIYDGNNKKQIIVYYNSDGYPEYVKIDDVEANTDKNTEQTGNLETDENGYYIDSDKPIYEEDLYLDDVMSLISSEDEDYNSEAVLQMLTERDFHYDELREHWGTPDEMLSGYWDIWNINSSKKMTVCYNNDGYVENVMIDNLETDGNGNDIGGPIIDENEYNDNE